MTKRRFLNEIKRKIWGSFKEANNGEKDWRGKMREELEKMAQLNGQLILMMK